MKFAGRPETASLCWRGSWAGCAGSAAASTSGESATGLAAGVRPRREWGRTKERNQIIRQLLAEGKGGLEICAALDARGVEVLPIMQKRGIHTLARRLGGPGPSTQHPTAFFEAALKVVKPVKHLLFPNRFQMQFLIEAKSKSA